MNAENVTPDEIAPHEPAAAETPTVVEVVETPAVAEVPIDYDAAVDDEAASNSATAEPVVVTQHTDTVVPVVPLVDTAATGEVAPVALPPQTVYVTAPVPPKPKGNRLVGLLLSVVATAVFAAIYAGVAIFLILVVKPVAVTGGLSVFLSSSAFVAPVVAFLVAMILWAMLANRASWWSWVIGSLVIALVTYFASVGALVLFAGGFGLTPTEATKYFTGLLINPYMIAAALIARECAIWFGAAIAKRGRKVRERNYEAWQAFENEEARKRAEFGGAAAA